MKLYMHPASTTSRPVMQFIADNKLPVESQVVDIFKGEHHGEAYARLNPNRLIPMLEDGDFRLTESAAILRYLADTSGGSAAAAYPKEPRRRAKVDEMLDWLNSNFYRDWGYGYVYPQVFPNLKRSDPVAQAATVAWGRDKSKTWLQILNDHWLGSDRAYLCGSEVTIADFFGLSLVTAGELVHCDITPHRNIARWVATMKSRPSYADVYQVFNGFCASTKGQAFEAL